MSVRLALAVILRPFVGLNTSAVGMENSRRTGGTPFAILMVVLFAGVLMGVSGCGGSDAAVSDGPSTMAGWFATWMPLWLAHVVTALIKCFLLINVVAVGALVFIWLERKIAGRIQDRLGPTRVGGRFGWLQTLADGLKLITKEDITPKGADRMLFKLAPYIAFAASYAAFLALPFANGWVAQNLNVAVFFILAVLGLEVFGVILAGYSSAPHLAGLVEVKHLELADRMLTGAGPARSRHRVQRTRLSVWPRYSTNGAIR